MPRGAEPLWPYGPIKTTYSTAELVPENTSYGIGVLLLLDGAQSSYLEMQNPQELMFEYMQYMQCVIRQLMPLAKYRDFVHLGGAGCALPRALHDEFRKTRHLAIEYDELLASYVRDWFDLPRSPALRIRVADAREALTTLRPASQDVITRDVFADQAVPNHTRTQEFFDLAASKLAPGGIFLANTASHRGQHELRREVAGLHAAFAYTAAIAEPGILKGKHYGNVVLLGSNDPVIDFTELDRRLRRLPLMPILWQRRQLTQLTQSAKPFTDPLSSQPSKSPE